MSTDRGLTDNERAELMPGTPIRWRTRHPNTAPWGPWQEGVVQSAHDYDGIHLRVHGPLGSKMVLSHDYVEVVEPIDDLTERLCGREQ